MNWRKLCCFLALFVFLYCGFAPSVESLIVACPVGHSVLKPTDAGVVLWVTKTFAFGEHWFCASDHTQMNAFMCGPNEHGDTVTMLSAFALPIMNHPRCEWFCDCRPVTIDGSDGLPVELLDFKVK